MPRLPPWLLRQARAISPRVADLLPVCRDLRSAQNELRWLHEHASKTCSSKRVHQFDSLLESYVARRARGEPLQYILGSEYFGDLEIQCRPGGLIPRPETAASVSYLAKLLSFRHDCLPKRLRVLDVCTGSGCIPLLFHHDFHASPANGNIELDLIGVDISPTALDLATDNLAAQVAAQAPPYSQDTTRLASLRSTRFIRGDILAPHDSDTQSVVEALQQHHGGPDVSYDVLISNPPYISSKAFRSTTARSVRHFEPKLALVPNHHASHGQAYDGDTFYPHLLHLADELNAKVLLFEVADMEQAVRVASRMTQQHEWDGIEIWRDEPSAEDATGKDALPVADREVSIRGAGDGRSVFAYRGAGSTWVGR